MTVAELVVRDNQLRALALFPHVGHTVAVICRDNLTLVLLVSPLVTVTLVCRGASMISQQAWVHEAFEDLFDRLVDGRKITPARVADVLARLMVASPAWPSQSELAQGSMLLMPSVIAADSVSRAVTALENLAMVSKHDYYNPGRDAPYQPIQLGSEKWAAIGIKIERPEASTVMVHILATELDGQPIDMPPAAALYSKEPRGVLNVQLSLGAEFPAMLSRIVEEVSTQEPLRNRLILGVGIDVAGHVSDDSVIAGTLIADDKPLDLAYHVSEHLSSLRERLVDARYVHRRTPFPVLVDNDLHILGALETYQPRFADRDWVVAAVFDDGVGSAPIVGGQVYGRPRNVGRDRPSPD